MGVNSANIAERLAQQRCRENRTESVATRFTKEEAALLATAASGEAKTLREWSREVLLREANRPKENALFIELVSMRMLLNNVLKVVATGQKITAENYQEIQTGVRAEKKRVALEIMQQYAAPAGKEQ